MKYELGQLVLLGNAIVAAGAIVRIPLARAGTLRSEVEEPRPNYLNAQPGVTYLGSEACAPCHKAIYDQFLKTEMGRSRSLPDVPSQFLDRGLALDIYISSFYTSLAACYRSIGKKKEAVQTLREGLKLFPGDLEMHGLLKKLEAEQLLR